MKKLGMVIGVALLLAACSKGPKAGDTYHDCQNTDSKPCAELQRDGTLKINYEKGNVPNIHPCEDVNYEELCFTQVGVSKSYPVTYEIHEVRR